MGKLARAALVTCALLSACSRHADREAVLGPAPEDPVIVGVGAIPAKDTNALAELRIHAGTDAAAFSRNTAALDRIAAFGGRSGLEKETALPGFGFRSGAFDRPVKAPALIADAAGTFPELAAFHASGGGLPAKAFGNGNAGGFQNDISFEGDTAWFVYDDSSRGRVHWIHVFHDSEEELHALVRDSLVYRWPYDPKAPILISSDTHVRYWDGSEYYTGLSGAAGADIAESGERLRILREWTTVSADTVRKSASLSQAGRVGGGAVDAGTAAYSGSGEDMTVSFADSVFIAGKLVLWNRTYDGDGDGFTLRAATGHRMIVRSDTYTLAADGTGILYRGAYGPGRDGEYAATEDNPRYPFSITVLSSRGDTLSMDRFGDADGDGFYFDPDAIAGNRAWETHSFVAPSRGALSPSAASGGSGASIGMDDYQSYRDSTVKILGETDRVIFYAAFAVGTDGRESRITCGASNTGAGFGSSDTVLVKEWRGPDDMSDSSIRFSSILPGDLVDPSDDRILAWSGQIWYKDDATAGSPPDARPWRREAADPDKGGLAWEERRYLANGDSTVATGRRFPDGIVSYRILSGAHVSNAGWYDTVAHTFSDTLRHTGDPTDGSGSDICEGEYADAAGTETGGFECRRASGDGNSIISRLLPGEYSRLGKAFAWTTVHGRATLSFTSVAHADGTHVITETDRDEKGGEAAEGLFTFLPDGSGGGSRAEFREAERNAVVGYTFLTDGTVRIVQEEQDKSQK